MLNQTYWSILGTHFPLFGKSEWHVLYFCDLINLSYSATSFHIRRTLDALISHAFPLHFHTWNLAYFRMYSKVVLLIFWGSPSVPQFGEWNLLPGSCLTSLLQRRLKSSCQGHLNGVKFGCQGHQNRVKIGYGDTKIEWNFNPEKIKIGFLGIFLNLEVYFCYIVPHILWPTGLMVKILKIVPPPLWVIRLYLQIFVQCLLGKGTIKIPSSFDY